MPIWGWGLLGAVTALVVWLVFRERSDRLVLLERLGKAVGATQPSGGWGPDYGVREGRFGGKRFQLIHYGGSEHHPAFLAVGILVSGPGRGEATTAAALERPWDRALGTPMFALGVQRLEWDDRSVRAVFQPAHLSDPQWEGKVRALLPELERFVRGRPTVDRALTAPPWVPKFPPMAELGLLLAFPFFAWMGLKGQTLDSVSAALKAAPWALGVLALRGWLLRRFPIPAASPARGALGRVFLVGWPLAVVVGWHQANQAWDRTPGEIRAALIQQKRLSRRQFRRVPLLKTELGYVEVDAALFAQAREGQRLELRWHPGAFGGAWVSGYRLASEGKETGEGT